MSATGLLVCGSAVRVLSVRLYSAARMQTAATASDSVSDVSCDRQSRLCALVLMCVTTTRTHDMRQRVSVSCGGCQCARVCLVAECDRHAAV